MYEEAPKVSCSAVCGVILFQQANRHESYHEYQNDKETAPPNVHKATDLKPGSCLESLRRGSFARCGMALLRRVSFAREPVGTLIIGRFLNSESSDTDISERAVWVESWDE